MNLDLCPREKTIHVNSNRYFAIKGNKTQTTAINGHTRPLKKPQKTMLSRNKATHGYEMQQETQ